MEKTNFPERELGLAGEEKKTIAYKAGLGTAGEGGERRKTVFAVKAWQSCLVVTAIAVALAVALFVAGVAVAGLVSSHTVFPVCPGCTLVQGVLSWKGICGLQNLQSPSGCRRRARWDWCIPFGTHSGTSRTRAYTRWQASAFRSRRLFPFLVLFPDGISWLLSRLWLPQQLHAGSHME